MKSKRATSPEGILGSSSVVRAARLRRVSGRHDIMGLLVDKGRLERISRGVYAVVDAPVTEKHGLAVVACRAPAGVVALLSALRFHGLTTQNPKEIWLAVPAGGRTPKLDWPPLRVVRMSAPTFQLGIETHFVEGIAVRVYSVPKTLVDCFKFRGQVGLDVALEALREGWRARRFTMDEIHEFAAACRMTNVMRPYLEALT